MDAQENRRETQRQKPSRKGERTQLQMAIENTGTKVYHLRVSHSTVVGAYDAIEAFGGNVGSKSIPQILITLLTESVATLRRDGHIPDRTPAEIADKLAQMSGDNEDINLPSMELQPTTSPPKTDIKQLIEQTLQAQKQVEREKPAELSQSAESAPSVEIVGDVSALSDEARILARKDDPLVQEVLNLATPESKQALLEAYTQLHSEHWGTDSARTLYELNLANKE